MDGLQAVCADCLRRERRAPFLRGVLAVLLLAVIGYGAFRGYTTYEPPYDYGEHTRKVRKLEADLKQEPCDRPKNQELLTLMLQAGDARGVIKRAEGFFAHCGDLVELRAITYRAHERLGESDAAVADITRLVDSAPYSPTYRAWRGYLYRNKGDLELAATDLREALSLYPEFTDVPVDLATVYEKLGRPCDAVFPLQQLVHHYPDRTWTAGIRARLAELDQRGSCSMSKSTSGRVILRMDPLRMATSARVRVEDAATGVFMLDTGASYVTLTRAFADKVGVSTSGAPALTLRTANGEKKGSLVSLRNVSLEGLSAKSVPAVVVDDLGPGVDGLLGLSFLMRFELRQANGVVELAARQTSAKTAR
jgi:aspartyl protease family protein